MARPPIEPAPDRIDPQAPQEDPALPEAEPTLRPGGSEIVSPPNESPLEQPPQEAPAPADCRMIRPVPVKWRRTAAAVDRLMFNK